MTNARPASALRRPPFDTIGLLLLHGATALWIGYGAVVKAVEFNPQLLPPPILKSLLWLAQSSSLAAGPFLEWSFRAIVGAEVFLALAILISARWARTIAIATLGFFCIILVVAMVQAGLKDGVAAALTGSCGCFGEKGLPASVMLLIDGLLLASAIALAPRGRAGSPVAVLAPLALGAITVVALPKPGVAGGSGAGGETPSAVGTAGGSGEDAPAATPWPAAPAKYEANYFPKWQDWVGKRLRDQPLALAIERPVPDDLETGTWIVVFSRPDCDNCQTFARAHFAAPRKERVLKVSVLDTVGKPLAMPCEGCVETSLFRVKAKEEGRSPNYLFQTPVCLRMTDGVVTAVCTDVDDAASLATVLEEKAGGEGTGPAEGDGATVPVTPPPQPARVWPGPPAQLEPFYVAEFGDAVGKPLADIEFARLVENRLPKDFLEGRWIVVFFREDCDHCFDLLASHFTGELPIRTLTIAIPDADPDSILGNPCDNCAKVSLLKGPNYVIGTPVVLAIEDGVVSCVVENVDDMAALEACIRFEGR